MLFNAFFVSASFIISHYVTGVRSCPGLTKRESESSTGAEVEYPWQEPPDETPSDLATTGYFINHLGLNVRNMTESVNWYKEAFGMRVLFVLHVSEHFSISYLGHSHGGRNGTGYQTVEELNRQKNNIEGLVELVSLEFPGWDLPSSIRVPNTFSHIGMVVPDVQATQARLEAMGANIIKGVGAEVTLDGPFGVANGFTQAGNAISQEERGLIHQALIPIDNPFVYVADPDGNVIEVQNQ